MSSKPILLEENNLSSAWCKTLAHIVNNKGREIKPLILSLTGFDEKEAVRTGLDAELEKNQENSVRTVSETIFPQSVYLFCGQDREALYNQYLENLPRMKAIDSRNKRGTYFERLIAFPTPGGTVNQLDYIIDGLNEKRGMRRSALQASLFDPSRDHRNDPYLGFPCLQQISCYKSDEGGLVLNAFYAVQLLYRKAYGNWLGLTNLGQFIAKEAGLTFERFNCFVGVEQLENQVSKDAAKRFIAFED